MFSFHYCQKISTFVAEMKKAVIIILVLLSSMGNLFAQDNLPSAPVEPRPDRAAEFGPAKHETWLDFDTKKKEKEVYTFSVNYRIGAGYVQDYEHSKDSTAANTYYHGTKVGFMVDFNLPYHLALQTGVFYALTYGTNEQHWRSTSKIDVQKEYITHRIYRHSLDIPIYLYWKQKLWKDLSLYFYTGPKFQIGLAEQDNIECTLSEGARAWLSNEGVRLESYDRYAENMVSRLNMQISLGGGLEWDKFRLQAGYDFGVNNLMPRGEWVRQHMWCWSWNVMFSYAF